MTIAQTFKVSKRLMNEAECHYGEGKPNLFLTKDYAGKYQWKVDPRPIDKTASPRVRTSKR